MRYRFFRVLSKVLQQVFTVGVRAFVITTVLGAIAVVVMHFLGMPLPSAGQLRHGVEGLLR